VYFTKDDITKLAAYATVIDDEIKQKNTDFLNLLTAIYQQRLKQLDSLSAIVCAKPFNVSLAEKYTVAEDTSYPANTTAAQQKLYKIFKLDMLEDMAGNMPANYKTLTPVLQKKYTDSAEALYRKKKVLTFKRKITNVLQNPYSMVQYMGNIYCETIAMCFDPHTYRNKVYLLFFKCARQESQVMDAISKKNITKTEQARSALLKYADDGFAVLDSLGGFDNDVTMIGTCKQALTFFKKEGKTELTKISDFLLKQENFAKIEASYNAKPKNSRTKEDDDGYKTALADVNKAYETAMQSVKGIVTDRNKVVNNWNNVEQKFIDAHMPYY